MNGVGLRLDKVLPLLMQAEGAPPPQQTANEQKMLNIHPMPQGSYSPEQFQSHPVDPRLLIHPTPVPENGRQSTTSSGFLQKLLGWGKKAAGFIGDVAKATPGFIQQHSTPNPRLAELLMGMAAAAAPPGSEQAQQYASMWQQMYGSRVAGEQEKEKQKQEMMRRALLAKLIGASVGIGGDALTALSALSPSTQVDVAGLLKKKQASWQPSTWKENGKVVYGAFNPVTGERKPYSEVPIEPKLPRVFGVTDKSGNTMFAYPTFDENGNLTLKPIEGYKPINQGITFVVGDLTDKKNKGSKSSYKWNYTE